MRYKIKPRNDGGYNLVVEYSSVDMITGEAYKGEEILRQVDCYEHAVAIVKHITQPDRYIKIEEQQP